MLVYSLRWLLFSEDGLRYELLYKTGSQYKESSDRARARSEAFTHRNCHPLGREVEGTGSNGSSPRTFRPSWP
jgi:hypothetical protein